VEVHTPTVSIGGVDVSRVIDETRLGRFQLRILILCFVVIMLDGFDVQVITYLAPVLTDAFHVQRSMLGPVFSAGLIGTVLGALIVAPFADRIGRKAGLMVCILLFGLYSLGTMTASSIESLMVWRLIGGLGLGSATPIAVTLGAEYSPKQIRPTAVMLIYCGFAAGAAGGGR
jgi:AAHS family 4-hydroxybenzoate transporter-like MFS transporter